MSNVITVKDHYDNHLGSIYSWMTGDFNSMSMEFKNFLIANSIKPSINKMAVDLGAGHGLQSIPLAEIGFQVLAIDFNQQLLDELKENAGYLSIKTVNDNIKKVAKFASKPELIVCCGDTLSHLENKSEVKNLILDSINSLCNNGKLILSFRDYTLKLTGNDRIIPVKSDSSRILTCILDYEDEFVFVTDLLYERTNDFWNQKVSTYKKVRLLTNEIVEFIESNGMTINFNQSVNKLSTIIATKER